MLRRRAGVPITPTRKELWDPNYTLPDVKPAIIDGPYSDAEAYLESQFDLMRADYVEAARQAVLSYFENKCKESAGCDGYVRRRKYRVFENSRLYDIEKTGRFVIAIDVDYTRLEADRDILLRPHDLLLVHVPNTPLMGLVIIENYSTEEDLLVVSLIHDSEIECTGACRALLSGMKFNIVELDCYLWPYASVLKVLSKMTKVNMPFQEHFLGLQEPYPPQYLQGVGRIDLTPLLVAPTDTLRTLGKDVKYELPTGYTEVKRIWDVRLGHIVASAHTLHVNPSQKKAIELALSKNVALIQGRKQSFESNGP
eukprot:Blabericola_migrator_1__9427@NODE_50_length_16319_cov_92_020182_g46_i0_p4_GENE_NODE_50_length_16319_cov_92_020182_g46_i0NODE_50_length_16319_cov_92_020182_g46_i0_p4_ORF_typecomplete_len311_score37_57Caps_synth_GfcC/PF06251_11/0_027AAA_11/PF13086_6/0_38_NODE_50_length_16319_cov_92_020182_g46_i090079939